MRVRARGVRRTGVRGGFTSRGSASRGPGELGSVGRTFWTDFWIGVRGQKPLGLGSEPRVRVRVRLVGV